MKLLPSLESTNVDSAFFYFDGRFGGVVGVGAAVETRKPLNERSTKKDVDPKNSRRLQNSNLLLHNKKLLLSSAMKQQLTNDYKLQTL